MPLNLITLRLQTEKQEAADDDEDEILDSRPPAPDVLSVMKLIYSERGLLGFWRGFETTILLSLNPSITLAFFQFLLRLKRSNSLKSSAKEAFVGGAISNSIAIALLYPLILAKTRLQAGNRQSNLVTVLDQASRSRTLYQGLDMQIAKGFLSQGVTFFIKERIEQAVVNMYLRRRSRMASR
ncbi:mitochondrial carrier [Hymenopellis radicata]|nr:mitochondrial carrier [Hymenopellis radicata]